MRTGNVVILLDVFLEQAVEMSLVQNDHVIEQLPAQRADKPLKEYIQEYSRVPSPHQGLDGGNSPITQEQFSGSAGRQAEFWSAAGCVITTTRCRVATGVRTGSLGS